MGSTKKDKRQVLIIIALLVVILTASGLGMYAWARYQTAISGASQAQVAKWSFKVNGAGTSFDTINLGETLNFDNVAPGTIAPGTNGAFNLVLDASGTEVSLDYHITVDVSGKPINMKFYEDSNKQIPLEVNSEGKLVLDGEILVGNTGTPVTKTIYWDWPYETESEVTQIVATSTENEENIVEELKKLAQFYNITVNETETANEIIAKLNGASVDKVEINDAIDTGESGRTVEMPITVMAEQKGEAVESGVKIGTLNVGDYVDIGKQLLNDGEVMYKDEAGNRAEWRVAKVDEASGKVTLILSDFLPTSKITNESSMGMTLDSNGYTLGWSSGSSGIAVDSLNDPDNWKNLLTGSNLGSNSEVIIKGALTKDDIPNSSNRVNTFVSHDAEFNGCYGYWLASDYDNRRVWYVRCSGDLSNLSCNNSSLFGVRPAVILDSDILVGNIGTNAYSIKK